jgi:hypothetical protein
MVVITTPLCQAQIYNQGVRSVFKMKGEETTMTTTTKWYATYECDKVLWKTGELQ